MNQAGSTEGTPTPGALESTVNEAVESVAARTPIPSPTPGLMQTGVNQFTETLGQASFEIFVKRFTERIDAPLGFLQVVFYVVLDFAFFFPEQHGLSPKLQ
jgi:hypothetical protein